MKAKNVRYTATLPSDCMEKLKEMADMKIIPSINYAINEALLEYIVSRKAAKYEESMREAGRDSSFLGRTEKCDDDFKYADYEVPDTW